MTTKRKAAKSATSARKPAMRSAQANVAIATSARSSVKERVAALAAAPVAVTESDANMQAVLNVLRNKEEPVQVRLAALQTLAAAAFSAIAFESFWGDYVLALREVADDPDPE